MTADHGVEFRCPVTPRRRHATVVDGEGHGAAPEPTSSPVYLDFKCDDCTRTARRDDDGVAVVTHQFHIATGQAVTTRVRYRDGRAAAVTRCSPTTSPQDRGGRDDDRTAAAPTGLPRRPR